MDQVSSHGYAWGYIGSCIPFALCLGLVLGAERIGLTMTAAIMLSLWIIALWWLLLSLPLLRSYRQRYFVERRPRAVAESFRRLGRTLANVKREKNIFCFCWHSFLYRRRVHHY